MMNFSCVTGFDWDKGNERKSVEKHAVSKLDAEQVFFNEPLLLLEDQKHSSEETRFHALGKTDARKLKVRLRLMLEMRRMNILPRFRKNHSLTTLP